MMIITGAPSKVGAHFVLIWRRVIFVFHLVFWGLFSPASCETFRAFFLGQSLDCKINVLLL